MTSDEIMAMVEKMMQKLMSEVKNINVSLPFERLSYTDAMERYGTDKPDTRFAMELIHVSDLVENSSFNVFKGAVEKGGNVCLLNVKKQAANYSRKDIDALTEYVKIYEAKGLARSEERRVGKERS